MPSNGTETITIRVHPEAKARFRDLAEENGLSQTEFFDEMLKRGTPLDDELGLQRIPEALREKGYPENAIMRMVDNIISQIRNGSKYYSRRDSGDWGC